MQKIIFYTVIILLSLVSKTFAQEKTFEERAKQIAINIENITKQEKEALKVEVEKIDNQLEQGKITKEKANELKIKIAEEKAKIIESKVAIEEEKLNQLIQDKVDGKVISKNDSIVIKGKKYTISVKERDNADKKEKKEKSKPRRTTSQFVFAAGLNNVITENEDLEHSDFRVWGSHFYEWGMTYNTRIFKNDNLLHAKYGFSVMYNNLRPTDNRYFQKNGDQTNLQVFPEHLKESRLRNVYLVFPAHLEFDFTPKKVSKDGEKTYFKTHESIRLGFGGYAGVRVKSKQILKYELDGDRIKDKQKGDFNTSDFSYGLSTYIGYKQTSLYLKYDLNPVFKDNAVDQNNVSLGIRFDFN